MPWAAFVSALHAFNKKCAFLHATKPLRKLLRDQTALFDSGQPKSSEPRRRQSRSDSHEPFQEGAKQSLLSLLVNVWARDASDPRDKIYAFSNQHLVSSYPQLTPDYSLDTRCTFIRFVRVYIENERSLEVLNYAKGIGVPLSITNPRPRMDGGRWIRLPNLLRTPPTGPQETSCSTTATDAHIDLPSWVCDWRKQSQRPEITDLPGTIEEDYFGARAKVPPMRQSIHDFSNRLVLRGCALARVAHHDTEALGAFLMLPKCALEKSLIKTAPRDYVPRQFQLSEVFARSDGPPRSSMTLLLLHTLLHDQSGCRCDDPPAGKRSTHSIEQDPRVLKARCQHAMYPRSRVYSLDWVFILDGFAKPVILRPHLVPSSSSDGRSEVGFDFISVCPLVLGSERSKWSGAPFAYGEVAMF